MVFGLFHGLCFLPVVLSIIGPSPYYNAGPEGTCTARFDHSTEQVEVSNILLIMRKILNHLFVFAGVTGCSISFYNGKQTYHNGSAETGCVLIKHPEFRFCEQIIYWLTWVFCLTAPVNEQQMTDFLLLCTGRILHVLQLFYGIV